MASRSSICLRQTITRKTLSSTRIHAQEWRHQIILCGCGLSHVNWLPTRHVYLSLRGVHFSWSFPIHPKDRFTNSIVTATSDNTRGIANTFIQNRAPKVALMTVKDNDIYTIIMVVIAKYRSIREHISFTRLMHSYS